MLMTYLFSLWGRVPDIDDAWIGEHAYWLAKEGTVKSELMRGITNQEDYLIVDHKLLTLQGAAFIKIFGYSLYSLKSVSLLYFIVFLILFILYTRKWYGIFNKKDLWLALVLLISFPWIFKYSFLFRPEILIMCLGFTAFILLKKYLEQSNNVFYVLMAGIVSGLSFVTHLNGLILIGSGFLLLVWNRSWKGSLIYSIGALVGISLYFYDFNNDHGLTLWLYQFIEAPALDSLNNIPVYIQPFINLLKEPFRYFHNLKIAFFSIFMFVTIISSIGWLYKKQKNMVRFTVLLIVLTSLIAMHKSRQYILVFLPYLIILITLSIKAFNENKITKFRISVIKNPVFIHKIIGLFFMIYLASGMYINIELSSVKFSPNDHRELSKKYSGGQTESMNIIAPMIFVFNEIENYNRIHGEVCYMELQKADHSVAGEGFIHKANQFNIGLIMLTPFYQEKLKMGHFTSGDTVVNFQVIDKTEELLVLRKN